MAATKLSIQPTDLRVPTHWRPWVDPWIPGQVKTQQTGSPYGHKADLLLLRLLELSFSSLIDSSHK
ncbi:unnamed protein product [Prunus armeniaca]|uniref:Uncharacterized protein n=1 Tax=Prunus armeniaca TaxID=36596 RepID=A0A6J5VNQ9_PRUAR|nr:unnamed protein product [Prunus armeniaca]